MGLVYVAALANERGQSVNDLFAGAPPSDAFKVVRADEEGWAILDRDAFPEIFAGDVPREQARVMAVSRQVVPPQAQRALAERIRATVTSIPASHAATVSRPDAVAEAINQAAAKKVRSAG